jgi:hypothetical protein
MDRTGAEPVMNANVFQNRGCNLAPPGRLAPSGVESERTRSSVNWVVERLAASAGSEQKSSRSSAHPEQSSGL